MRSASAAEDLSSPPGWRVWSSLFLLSAAGFAFEITLTRLFSVAQFYHFAFMVVSIALLGYAASGTALSTLPLLQRTPAANRLMTFATGASASMVAGFLLTNWVPFDSYSIAWDGSQVLVLIVHYLALAAPFFFCGLALGSMLSEVPWLAGTTYAVNLTGSALGCVLALIAPVLFGGEGTVALCVLLGATAALASFDTGHMGSATKFWNLGLSGVLLLCSAVYIALRAAADPLADQLRLRISPYKSLSYALDNPEARLVHTSWNAFSRVDIVESAAIHSVPGLSYRYLRPLPEMDGLFVDGDNLSPVIRTTQVGDFAEYIPQAVALHLRPDARVLILQPRGGLDAVAARALNDGPITLVEANPLIVGAVPIYQDPRLRVEVASDRSFLSRSSDKYDVIIQSLTESFHPVRSGAYALGEEYRYTLEAFGAILAHLDDGGLLVSSRWLQAPPSEDLRLFALGLSALEEAGHDPRAELVAFRGYRMGTVLLRNGAFTADELATIRAFLATRAFDLIYAPDVRSSEPNRFSVLAEPTYYETYAGLLNSGPHDSFYKAYEYDVRPPRDDHPFFGHYFKWSQAPQIAAELGTAWLPFGGAGYFVILALLLLTVLLAAVLVLLPIALEKARRVIRSAELSNHHLLYFGFLGFAYLLIEIPIMQDFILYLSQPAYAVGVVLFSLMLFSGVGSLLGSRAPLRWSLAILTVIVLLQPVVLPRLFEGTLEAPLGARFLISILAIAPLGFLMGIPFPAGIRLVADRPRASRIAWVWAVNGGASVVASVLAALMALTFGFSWVLWCGALCYAAAWLTVPSLAAPAARPLP